MLKNRSTSCLLGIACAALLSACGGGDSLNTIPVPDLDGGTGGSGGGGSGSGSSTRNVVVTVQGLSTGDTLAVNVGSSQLSFSSNGTQNIANVPNGESVEATLGASPAGAVCLFLPSLQSVIDVGTDVNVQCGTVSVTGETRDFVSGDSVASPTITLSRNGVASAPVSPATDGSFVIDTPVLDEELIMFASTRGYASNSLIVTPTAVRPFINRSLFLKPVDDLVSLDPTAVMNFVYDGVVVLTIPANGLVNGAAAPVGNVTAEITVLDGSGEPASLPGNYQLASSASVESFGGLAISIYDSADNLLTLAGGVNATLSVPVASTIASTIEESQIGDPATVYSFNPVSGAWEDSLAATLGFQGVDWVYSTTISSLDEIYMAAETYTSTQISGCVADSLGNRIAGVQVVTQGVDYIGLNFATSDQNGNFIAEAKANSEVLVYALDSTRSQTLTVDTGTSIQVLDDCNILDDTSTVIELTWGENPSDLDSQLYGPDPSDTDGRFHVSYRDRDVTVNGVEIFLDVDDVTSFGPEVTTIPSFPLPGTYEFLVDLFAGTGTIANSPARVEANVQGVRSVFSPPEGTPTRCWHVFNIVVDDNLRGTIQPVDGWVARDVCTSTGTL